MSAREKLAYLAGIFDGEGHFSIVLYRALRKHFPIVGVMNTDEGLMQWLSENYGGAIYHRKSPSNKAHWKARFEWRIYSAAIDRLIPAMLPFMVIKRRQAELLLRFRATFQQPVRRPISDELFATREAIRTELLATNDRRRIS